MNTLIKNGTVVTPQTSFAGDIRVSDGKITELGPSLPDGGSEIYDASGCLLMPGFIDAHTHLEMDNGVTVTSDDFRSGTRAALFGGTTTLIDFATQDKGMTLEQALALWHGRADGNCSCDYAFHMAITDWNSETSKSIDLMVSEGVTSFKLYLAYDNLRVSDAQLYEVLRRVAQVHGIVGVHCENGDLVNEKLAEYRSSGRLSPEYHPFTRPDYVEAEAVARYCYIAKAADVAVHIVHLSTRLGLEEALRARARGQKVYIETCPHYLTLDDSCYKLPDFESAKFVCSPPMRGLDDQAALWAAVSGGVIDSISTDHCSFNFKGQKELGRGDFGKIPNGIPGLEHRPALIYTSGVAAGRITENDMVRLLSENAARLFGMYPRKGVLAVGSDADIVVWDKCKSWTATAVDYHGNCDYIPYEGMKLQGAARAVFLRGELAVSDGKQLRENAGHYVARGASEYY